MSTIYITLYVILKYILQTVYELKNIYVSNLKIFSESAFFKRALRESSMICLRKSIQLCENLVMTIKSMHRLKL